MKAYGQQTIDEIRTLYRQGFSTYELSEQYYCCRQTIWEYVKDIKERKKNRCKRKLNDERIAQVKEARRLGTQRKELAMMLGVSGATISRWVKVG